MRQSHGETPACIAAFCLAHQARRYALLKAARDGRVTALDLRHEFPNFARTNAHEVLHVLRDKGLLRSDGFVKDLQGKMRQLTYVPTEPGRQALRDLSAYLSDLLSHLEVSDGE